jgi:hypothetical protein
LIAFSVCLALGVFVDGGSILDRLGALNGAVISGALGVNRWRAGIWVDERGVRFRRGVYSLLPEKEESFAWSDIQGYDDPTLRLGDDAVGGYLELFVGPGPPVILPRIKHKAALSTELGRRLGSPGRVPEHP